MCIVSIEALEKRAVHMSPSVMYISPLKFARNTW
jgi:hypothetical protein